MQFIKNLWAAPIGKLIILAVIGGGAWYGLKAVEKSKGGTIVAAVTGKAAVGSNKVVDEVGGKDALNVCINQWSGFAGGAYMNGAGPASESSRFYQEHDIPVNLIFIPGLASLDAWKADQCQVHWVTFDAWSPYVVGIADEKPEGFLMIDWSNGGDVFLGAPGIKSVSDLRGQQVAVATKSPSQTLLLRALEAANMTQNDIKVVEVEDGLGAASAFEAGKVKGALVWAPDDARLLNSVPGSRVLMSTKQCNRCIADGFFAKADFIAENTDRLKAFAEGWLKGNAAVKSNPEAQDEAARVLAAIYEVSVDDIKSTLDKAEFATVGDNQKFFGVASGGAGNVTGRQLYTDMSYKFREVGVLTEDVPEWSKVSNSAIVRALAITSVAQQATAPQKFEPLSQAAASRAEAVATRQVTIEFAYNSDVLSDEAKLSLDGDLRTIITSMGGARFRIEGNTDSQGDDAYNQSLSLRRARAVANYLASRYGADPDKFVVQGNGESKPVADNATEDGRRKNRRTDVRILDIQ